MEERTQAYLRGRFGDYYRRTDITPPPDANEREWGYIPWTSGPGMTMVRHKSLLDLGDLESFLERKRPSHVYFSAGRYEDPSASSMSEKGWRASDLIFDLDADHLPSVVLGEDSYSEMLAKCKDALRRLLDFLENDFGFDDLTIVFSGGRGYHVHVRDPGIQTLDRDARREIVDYVRGTGLDFDALTTEEVVGGEIGRDSPAHKKTLSTAGGWSQRTHRNVIEFIEELLAMDEDTAIDRLQEFDGIGEKKASATLNIVQTNTEEIRAGNMDVHHAFQKIVEILLHETVSENNAPIDEPVTTDTNRLIRLPGTLHGGSGLEVQRISRDDIDDFEPLVDAIPETFVGHDITVEVTDGGDVSLGGDSFTLPERQHTVPEYLGVFLMARGRAEKGPE